MPEEVARAEIDEILFDALRTIFAFEREKVSVFDLTYGEIYLLQFLRRRSNAPMSEIATEMQIPISTATRLIDRLEKRNLLSRRKCDNDRRKMLVTLREDGKKLVGQVEDHTYDIVMNNLKKFSNQEILCFIDTASQLKEILLTK
jgi:MarR family transcriptional regulator, organic hydroperoxide resistance regulator